jgi:uncharacterized protein
MNRSFKNRNIRFFISLSFPSWSVFILVLLFLLLGCSPQTNDFYFPSYDGYVNDFTGILSKEDLEKSQNLVISIEKETSCEVAVAIVDDLGPYTIEEYALRLFSAWEIGKKEKDNGVLLLVSMQDRQLRIEIGYGLESIITDLEAKYIIEDVIVPKFKNEDYGSGIYNGIAAIANHIYEEEGINQIAYIQENTLKVEDSEDSILIKVIVILANILPFIIVASVIGSLFLRHYFKHNRCPECKKIALITKKKILVAPTYDTTGRAHIEKYCRKCSFREKSTITLPILHKGSNGDHGGSGNSFPSGGGNSGSTSSSSSFGGGSSGGGGASGRW